MDLQKLQAIFILAGEIAILIPALLGAALAIALVIPGEHPDKELDWALKKGEWIVDLIKKISRKPAAEEPKQ